MNQLKLKYKILLQVQKVLGNIAFFILGNLVVFYFKYIKKYKINQIKELRKFYKNIIKKNKPLLICPNHLTMVDSALIQWALGSIWFYLFRFDKFPWNIPAKENVEKSVLFRIITYLTKCILIDRNGSKEHKDLIVQELAYLLTKKEPICIFIEGTRSPTGKLLEEQINYGAGQLAYDIPETEILIIYFRGKNQTQKSDFPKKNEEFFVRYNLIKPQYHSKGFRAHREITLQILQELKNFENEYFSFYK